MLYWFIVEGPDNIGKTTMIDGIASKLSKAGIDVRVEHFGAPKGKTKADKIMYAMDEATSTAHTIRALANEAFSQDIVLIHDRSIFGELVYSKYRGYGAEHLNEVVMTLSSINHLRTTFIILYGNANDAKRVGVGFKDDCNEDYAQRDEMQSVSDEFVRRIHALDYPAARKLVFNLANYASLDERNTYVYAHVRAITNDVTYKFKRTNSHVDTPFNAKQQIFGDEGFVANTVFKCKRYSTCPLGKEHKLNCKDNGGLSAPIYGYGGMQPKMIFIGEVSHHNPDFAGHLPFYNSVSGNLLQQALYDLKISPFDVYITNVIKCTPRNNDLGIYSNIVNAAELACVSNISAEIRALKPRTNLVVCLGATAYAFAMYKISKKHGFNIKRVTHPSYHARMGTSDKFVTDISKILRETLNERP